MGSGKTSIGLLLAKKIKKNFYDSDREIERRAGVTISWIFEVETEQGFRYREEKMIAELTQKNNIILATGGGSILFPTNRENLKTHGVVIYLQVSLKEQLKRTGVRKGIRPLADGPDREKRLAELNEIRSPLYLEIADLVYETDHKTPVELVNQMLMDLNFENK